MCVLCTQLWVEEHWTEAMLESPPANNNVVALETHAVRRGERLRARARRSRLFNLALAQCGLSLQDWEGSHYVLRDRKGRAAVIPNLTQVWPEAARMSGDSLDPLDPDHLQRLERLIARMTMEP